jgi:thiamine-monophosphate kinase
VREFAIIDGVFAPMARSRPEVLLGMGDDAAILAPGSGEHWCWSIDTLVEGVHFAVSDAPEDIGWKSLAVNLSDLAAMGARPVAVLLALTLPDGDGAWVRAFARGFDALAAQHGVCLAGGDTTRGPRSISVTVMGALPAGSGLRRDGAREGDIIAVTGTLGDAALALRLGARADADLRARLHRPMPRLAAGQALRGLAHAAVDVSDGLLADLGHVMRASGTAAAVRADLLPASKAFADAAPPQDRGALQAAGGDDYELCCCLAPDQVGEAVIALAALNLPLTVIGRVGAGKGAVQLMEADGTPVVLPADGYDHFSS